jgi:hypothetical protein
VFPLFLFFLILMFGSCFSANISYFCLIHIGTFELWGFGKSHSSLVPALCVRISFVCISFITPENRPAMY